MSEPLIVSNYMSNYHTHSHLFPYAEVRKVGKTDWLDVIIFEGDQRLARVLVKKMETVKELLYTINKGTRYPQSIAMALRDRLEPWERFQGW